jgi:hypothetical protein
MLACDALNGLNSRAKKCCLFVGALATSDVKEEAPVHAIINHGCSTAA